MTSALEIGGLHKQFGTVHAVSGVDLVVRRGEVVALLGPNGSGKSTLLRCVAGLLRPTAGSIRVDGIDARRQPKAARCKFRYLPQNATFPAHVTVLETAMFHARLRRLSPSTAQAAAAAAGLAEALHRPTGELSGGMRQRLALALATLGATPLMLLDEPTANLDPQGALHFRGQVAAWRQEGRALLISTHVLADVDAWADRVLILVHGCPVAEQSIQRLREQLDQAARMRVFVDRPGPEHVAAAMNSGAQHAEWNCQAVLVSAVRERRLEILTQLARISPVHRFETEQPALEDLYLRYVQAGPDMESHDASA